METVKFRLEAYVDCTPVQGNTGCTGDDDVVHDIEDAIIDEIADGNVWAWASVNVTAYIDDVEYRSYRSCCSYVNEAAFRDSQCYLDMKRDALSALRTDLEGRLQSVDSAEHALAEDCRAHAALGGPNCSDNHTEVIFLRDNSDGDILAVFPGKVKEYESIGSYSHDDLHRPASLWYCADCVEVTDPLEYNELADELKRIGYRLRVVSKPGIGKGESWACTSCDNYADVHPSEYDEIGIPYCSDCDQEMERV